MNNFILFLLNLFIQLIIDVNGNLQYNNVSNTTSNNNLLPLQNTTKIYCNANETKIIQKKTLELEASLNQEVYGSNATNDNNSLTQATSNLIETKTLKVESLTKEKVENETLLVTNETELNKNLKTLESEASLNQEVYGLNKSLTPLPTIQVSPLSKKLFVTPFKTIEITDSTDRQPIKETKTLTTTKETLVTEFSVASNKKKIINNETASTTQNFQISDSTQQINWKSFQINCSEEIDEQGTELCNEWAEAGLCTKNRATMFLFCRLTCLCVGPFKNNQLNNNENNENQ